MMFPHPCNYKPSPLIKSLNDSGGLWPCTGLPELVAEAHNAGMEVCVDLGDLTQVSPHNVRLAVHETDTSCLYFRKGGKRVGAALVIPANDKDWLADYHVALEPLVERVLVYIYPDEYSLTQKQEKLGGAPNEIVE